MTAVAQNANGAGVAKVASVKGLLESADIKKRFDEILGNKAAGFVSSVINVVNGNTNLKLADPQSVVMAAAVAATLDLPINPNLGFAYIIPYAINKQVDGQWKQQQVAQFQMGYKGFIQLAQRTGLYDKINCIEVGKNQLKSFNPLTEEIVLDFTVQEPGETVGYVAYFKLLTGFSKTIYWNIGKINEHAKKFSKSFGSKTSPWTTNFEEMAKKTLIKHILSKYGPLSIDAQMQRAIQVDQAVVNDLHGSELVYEDAPSTDVTNQAKIEESTATELKPNTEFQEQSGSNSNDLDTSDL